MNLPRRRSDKSLDHRTGEITIKQTVELDLVIGEVCYVQSIHVKLDCPTGVVLHENRTSLRL